MKLCNKCKKEKPLTDFFKDSRNKLTGRYSICKACKKSSTYEWRNKNREKYNLIAKDWRRNNREAERKYNLRKRGITSKEYELMLKEQNGSCKICGKGYEKQRYKRLAVDHCHKTKKVRGLLCYQCNSALGLFYDNSELLGKAIAYLEKFNP